MNRQPHRGLPRGRWQRGRGSVRCARFAGWAAMLAWTCASGSAYAFRTAGDLPEFDGKSR